MLSENQVKEKLIEAEKKREELGPSVTVEINGYVALMQLVEETKITAFKNVLEMI